MHCHHGTQRSANKLVHSLKRTASSYHSSAQRRRSYVQNWLALSGRRSQIQSTGQTFWLELRGNLGGRCAQTHSTCLVRQAARTQPNQEKPTNKTWVFFKYKSTSLCHPPEFARRTTEGTHNLLACPTFAIPQRRPTSTASTHSTDINSSETDRWTAFLWPSRSD